MFSDRSVFLIFVLSLSLFLPTFVYAAPGDDTDQPAQTTRVYLPLVTTSATAAAAAPIIDSGTAAAGEPAEATEGAVVSDIAPADPNLSLISSDAFEVLDETIALDGGITVEVVDAAAVDLACNNAGFTSSIAGGFLSSTPFIRLDRTPVSYPSSFPSDCYNSGNGQCWGNPRHQYSARWNGIREWRGKICARSVQTPSNNHIISYQSSANSSCPVGGATFCQMYVGPVIGFQTKGRNEAENRWRWLENNGQQAVYSIPSNQTLAYQWAWNANQSSDFRLVVRYAKPRDQFDFMMDRRP